MGRNSAAAMRFRDGASQAEGKTERRHRNLKSRILLENGVLPGDLDHQIEAWVKGERYCASLDNSTLATAGPIPSSNNARGSGGR